MAQLKSIDNKSFISLKPLYIENHESGDEIIWITSELHIFDNNGHSYKVTSAFLTADEYEEILNAIEQVSRGNMNKYSVSELIEPMFHFSVSANGSNVEITVSYNEDFMGDMPEKKHVIKLISTKHSFGAFGTDLKEEFNAVNK